MTPREAGLYLGLSVKTLAMRRCDGTGPQYVKRGRVFYYQNDLDEWLKAGRMLSTTKPAPAGKSGKTRQAEPKAMPR